VLPRPWRRHQVEAELGLDLVAPPGAGQH